MTKSECLSIKPFKVLGHDPKNLQVDAEAIGYAENRVADQCTHFVPGYYNNILSLGNEKSSKRES